MSKIAKNLFLEEAAVARGERYSAHHNTNLSQIVSDYLSQLPENQAPRPLAPATSRLLGVAGGSSLDHEGYRSRLRKKYGGR